MDGFRDSQQMLHGLLSPLGNLWFKEIVYYKNYLKY